MRKLFGVLSGAIVFGLLSVTVAKVVRAAPGPTKGIASISSEQVTDGAALTIYNQNFFVAREYVALDLQAGVNEAQYTGVAAHLEPDSVILRDPGGRALQIF